jgi:hypothetical protein
MRYETTKALIDLTASITHDQEEADWYDVHELIELLPNAAVVLKDLLHWIHEEELI